MARVWNTFTAPDGRKYYYNRKTKQSTWQRPESFDDDESRHGSKRAKLASEIEPFYVIPLLNGWNLVIGDTGDKFYYNEGLKESKWELPDTQSLQLLSSIDKDKLVPLIAIARGYNTERSEQIYEEAIHEVDVLRETLLLDQKTDGEAEDVESDTEEVAGGLVTAYSSSDESEAEEDDENDEKGAYDYDIEALNNLDDPRKLSERPEGGSSARDILFALFDKYGCDPYSAWSIQARKVQDDPAFLEVADDSLREEIFEEWCEQNVKNVQTEGADLEIEESVDTDGDASADETLEPLKFHYLAHIVSKANITPTTIFLDFKNENKAEFKKYKIKQFVESKRLQETFVSKLLFYYKKMANDERKIVFREALDTHQDSIKENIHRNLETVRRFLNETPADSDDAFAIESSLLKMENWMGISNNIPELADDPRYYVLGIKDKMMESMQYINDFV